MRQGTLTVGTLKGVLLLLLRVVMAGIGAGLLIFATPRFRGGTGTKVLVWSVFSLILTMGLALMSTAFGK